MCYLDLDLVKSLVNTLLFSIYDRHIIVVYYGSYLF